MLAEDPLGAVAETATAILYLVVLLWGTRLAANAVVSEIRGRTWDTQRITSLSPWAMLSGKLFGAPIVTLYAAALCLAPIVLHKLAAEGLGEAVFEAAYFVTMVLFALSVSLLASLIGIRRRPAVSRLDGFIYQLAGIAGGLGAAGIFASAREADALHTIHWWGTSWNGQTFTVASLVVFLAWSLVGNWRLMRRELQVRGGPWVWLAFLGFMLVYYAGFADAVGNAEARHAIRLATMAGVAASLTYAMVLLEPKDPVHIRWLLAQVAGGRLDRAFLGLQSWMFAYLAAVAITLWLVLTLQVPDGIDIVASARDLPGWGASTSIEVPRIAWREVLIALLMFLTRDVLIFLVFNFTPGNKRGDFVALIWLFILYAVLPSVVVGANASYVTALFWAVPTSPPIVGPLLPALEAAVLFLIAGRRLYRVRSD